MSDWRNWVVVALGVYLLVDYLRHGPVRRWIGRLGSDDS